MASKCKYFMINTALPFSILIICLFQLYFQYSTFMTPRSKIYNDKDKRNSLISFMIWHKYFDLNVEKMKESFEDNPLMKINILKNYTLKGFNKINEKMENQIDKKKLMFFFLIFYDIIFVIFIYIFMFGGFKSGIMKIIIQFFKFYYAGKRIKYSNPDICICETILNFFRNLGLRDWGLFTPDGYQILEFLLNFVIILDLIWLILIKKKMNKRKGEYIELTEKQIMTDDDRVYNNYNDIDSDSKKIIIESDKEKIFSNEYNNKSDENDEYIKEDNNEDSKDYDNEDNKYDDKEDDKEDDNYIITENINKNNCDENNNINNSESIENNNIESNNIFENNINDEVKNSIREGEENNKIHLDKFEGDEEECEENKEISEEGINEQETK